MTRGERVIEFCHQYCVIPEGDKVGQPVVLAEFQKKFILEVYDNPAVTDTGILSIARKNAKTGTIAFILLAHTVGPEAVQNSRIVSGAMSREQAAEVYNLASKCVMLSPKLNKIVKIVPSSKKLIGLPMNVEYQAISADGKTAHGKSPILAILDEVGQVKGPQSDFIDAITTAQGAYDNPLLLYISTQAATDADLFSVLIDDAQVNKHPKTVCHVYAADDDADLMDREQWKKANPAMNLFRSEADMLKQAEKAQRMPSFENTFRNLNLNQRVESSSPFVNHTVWAECGGKPVYSGVAYGGLDLSETNDLTALILVFLKDGVVNTKCHFWLPAEGLAERSKQDRVPYDVWAKQGFLSTTPGRSIEYEYVAKVIANMFTEHDIRKLAFDRYNMRHLRPWLVQAGLSDSLIEDRFQDFGQGFVSMSPALRNLETILLNSKLRHGDHPILKMCAANSVVRMDEAGNRKLDKKRSRGRIDGMVALAMACAVANEHQGHKKVFSVNLTSILTDAA
jgi:phage terminase large subunit-like protein